MTQDILFEYKKSTKKEGIQTLIKNLALLIFFAAGLYFFSHFGAPKAIIIIAIVIISIIFIILLVYSIWNIRLDREFSITITKEHIECRIPEEAFGRSFNIKISDIDTILQESPPDESVDWYIITKQNERIKLTPNYNNPISKIVEILREQNYLIKFKRVR